MQMHRFRRPLRQDLPRCPNPLTPMQQGVAGVVADGRARHRWIKFVDKSGMLRILEDEYHLLETGRTRRVCGRPDQSVDGIS